MAAYLRPDTLDEAFAALTHAAPLVAAGCTDLFPATEQQELPGPILDITSIAGLRGIRETDAGWRIGATTRWSDVIAADLPDAFDMLKQAAHQVGSVQIQNSGTVAGNLCNASPAADGVPPLLALNAEVELSSQKGTRQLPLSRFLLGVRKTALAPGEILTAIVVPHSAGAGISRFSKLGARSYMVISIAMVAARLSVKKGRVDQVAISVGACSAVACRLAALEQALQGLLLADVATAITPDLIAPALSPIDDIRGDAAYRTDAAVTLVARVLNDLVQNRGALT